MPDQGQALPDRRLFRALENQRSAALFQPPERRTQRALAPRRHPGQRNPHGGRIERPGRNRPTNERAKAAARRRTRENAGPSCHPTFPISNSAAARLNNRSPIGRGKRSKDFGIELLDERFKRSKYNPAVARENHRADVERAAPDRLEVSFRRARRSGQHQRPKRKRSRFDSIEPRPGTR